MNRSPTKLARQESGTESQYFKNIQSRRQSQLQLEPGSSVLRNTPTSRQKTTKKKADFPDIKNMREEECAYKVWKHMLFNYEKQEKPVKSGTLPFGFDLTINFESKIKLDEYPTLTELKPEILYLITVCQTKELHEFFIEYYANFDSNKNFILELSEFAKIVKVMTNEKNMGMKKFKVFADIALKYGTNGMQFNDKVDLEIVQEMFSVFKLVQANDDDQNQVIDYLSFFPFLLSFFFEYSSNEINFRKERFDVQILFPIIKQLIRGIEVINQKEKEIKNIYSLITLLKEMGIDYFKSGVRETSPLSYRDIENILLKFKNIQKWITFDMIKQIMQQLEKKMKVEYRTKVEKKRIKLYKLINFLALKLCIHQNCQHKKVSTKSTQQTDYLEIMVWWHAAFYSTILKNKGSQLRLAFDEFMASKYPQIQDLTRYDCQLITEKFFRKHFPLMPKDSVKRIVRRHSSFRNEEDLVKNPHISISEYGEELFDMICVDGDEKIKNYIAKTIKGITNRDQQMKNQQDKYMDRGNAGFNGAKSPSNGQSPMKPPPIQEDQPDEVLEQDQEMDRQRKDSGATPLHKFQKAVHAIQGEHIITETLIENKKPKDVLKACFIMENFLQRLVHKHRKDINPKDVTEFEKGSIQYDDDDDDDDDNILEGGDGQPVDFQSQMEQQKQKDSMLEDEKIDVKKSVLKNTEERKYLEQKETKSMNKMKLVAIQGLGGMDKEMESDTALQNVQGINAANFGPSNIKRVDQQRQAQKGAPSNTLSHVAGHFSHSQQTKILMVAATQMEHQTNKPYTANYNFHIKEEELEIEIQKEKLKQERKRDNCQCTLF